MQTITVAAVADISTGPEPPEPREGAFIHVLQHLRSADLRFAHVERVYSQRGSWQQQAVQVHAPEHPRMAAALKTVPFDVLSIASNHTGDWGPEAAADTVETFRLLEIPTVGAGRNIEEARRPAIVSRKGLRIAFLGYVSVTLPQYWATENRAGSVSSFWTFRHSRKSTRFRSLHRTICN